MPFLTSATPVGRPVVVNEVMPPDRAPGVKKHDIEVLRHRLRTGDRAGVYADLYRMTGAEIWLMHAQITSYSGLYGGAALSANFLAKLANPNNYDVSLDRFSRQIVESMIE